MVHIDPEEINDKGNKYWGSEQMRVWYSNGEYLFPEGVFISYQEISTGEYIFPRK